MARYEAVLFDWMLTLAEYPNAQAHVRRAHEVLGRTSDAGAVDSIVGQLETASHAPDVVAAMAVEDCSADLHREANMLLFERASIDADLAGALYGLLGDPAFHPLYAESSTVLRRLEDLGVRVAVISDIHVDLRAHAASCGIGDLIDAWILSYEHGMQKPDPAMFQLALDALAVTPAAALMVGDRARDGAAAELDIDTLLLPARRSAPSVRSTRLDAVLQLVDP